VISRHVRGFGRIDSLARGMCYPEAATSIPAPSQTQRPGGLVVMRDVLIRSRSSFSEIGADEGIPTNILSERLERL